MLRVGLFGGSFDPVHNGHIAIADSFLNSGKIDELWILLTPDPPHKTDSAQTDFNIRMKMLRAAFNRTKIKLLDVERRLPKPSYTHKTIVYLKETYPDIDFLYCIGEDSLQQFKSWKNYLMILNEVHLLVAKRPGYSTENTDQNILEKVIFVEHQPIAVSSTEIRKMTAEKKSITAYVPEAVQQIIQKYQLYQ